MEKELLRKVQLTQLEIAKEVKRVCEKNNIPYFLTAGTLLGAIRHKGFIPWDDDLDMGMLKENYDRFVKIAQEDLDSRYELETWNTNENCPYEYAKVRKKGTAFVEGKTNYKTEPGIFVDIICYVNAPLVKEEQDMIHKKMVELHRLLLMKCGFQPWRENGKTNIKKRIGYLLYQVKAVFCSRKKLIGEFEKLQNLVLESPYLYGMVESYEYKVLDRKWVEEVVDVLFEDTMFSIPAKYENYLQISYGDYMQLPPESERENRHQIVKLDFGDMN